MILSGHQRFDYAQKALKLHCASYVLKPISITIYPILIWTVLLLQNICIWVRIIYLMYFIRNLARLLVLTLHPCALIRQRSFLKEPTGEWILLQKKLDFPAAPTFINNSKKWPVLLRSNTGLNKIFIIYRTENTFVPCAGTTTVNASFPLCKTSPLHSSVNL